MSSDALPITPARFAEAIQDLSLSSLHLKVLEIRNDIAHLDYSNEQLLPYAQGTAAVLGSDGTPSEPRPDQDCIDAIRENEAVIGRKLEQIRLVRVEVERRGCSWAEFQSKEEVEQEENEIGERERPAGRAARGAAALAMAQMSRTNGTTEEADTPGAAPAPASAGEALPTTNGTSSRPSGGDPWSDGTFQTGTIRNGELQMDPPGSRPFGGAGASAGTGSSATGGSLSDEQLRRALEERLRMDHEGSNGQTNGHAADDDGDDDDEEGMHL